MLGYYLVYLLCVVGFLSLITILLYNQDKKYRNRNNDSREIIQMLDKIRIDNDKDNPTLSEMIDYHKKNPTNEYRI